MAKTRIAREGDQPRGGSVVGVAVLAALLLLATGWLIVIEWSPEYQTYQREFREAVARRWGARAADAVPRGVQQVWSPQAGDANRCVTCHLATSWKGFEGEPEPLRTHPEEILKQHPVDRFGCTGCHGGQGWAVDRRRAHGDVPDWSEPLLDTTLGNLLMPGAGRAALMEVRCNTCHRYERVTAGMPHVNRGKRLVEEKGCRACHRINGRGGLIGPDLDWTGDKNPAQYDYRHLPGRPSAFRWQAAHLKDPRQFVADTVMPNFHFSEEDIRALALLVMSWRRAPIDATGGGTLPTSEPEPEEQRRAFAEMAQGPGAWFVRTGCYTCHPVAVFGVRSPTPIGPDLSTAAEDAERRYSKPIDEFVRNPVGTMRAVFSRQFMLTPEQKNEAVRQLRAAFAEYQRVQASGRNPLEPAK